MVGHPILGDRRYHHGWAAEKRRLAQLDLPFGGQESDSQRQDGNCVAASDQEAASDSSDQDLHGEQPATDGMEMRDAAESADAQCYGGGASASAEDNSTATAGPVRPADDGYLCLWAVQIQLQHPVTLEELDVCIPEPDAYAALRARHTGSTAD